MLGRKPSLVLHIALFIGCGYILHIADCLALSAKYESNNAVFTCVIDPYTNSQRWYIDSVVVSDCGAKSCVETPSNPQHYSFTSNLTTGLFEFKIDPITACEDGKKIECYDGTTKQELTISTDSTAGSESLCDDTIVIIVGIVCGLIIFFLLLLIVGGIIYFSKGQDAEKNGGFYLVNVGQRSIKVRWHMCEKDRSAIYYTLACEQNKLNVLMVSPYDNKRDFIPEYQINGLEPSTSYKLILRCFVKNEKMDDLDDIEYKVYNTIDVTTHSQSDETNDDTDEFHVISVEQNSIKVRWMLFKEEGTNKKYSLSYSNEQNPYDWTDDGKGNFKEHKIDGLKESTLYQLRLTCVDAQDKVIKEYKTLDVSTKDSSDALWSSDVENTSMTLHFPTHSNDTKYILSYLKDGISTDENVNDQEHKVTGLKPSTLYEFTLRCCDKSNNLLNVFEPFFQTTTDGKTAKKNECVVARKEEFSTVKVTATSIKVRWEVCKSSIPKTKKYLISYFENGTTKDECCDHKENQLFMEHTFVGLTPSALYSFNLRCIDELNQLRKTYKILNQRTNDSPNENEFWASERTATSIHLHWSICKREPMGEKYVLIYFGNGELNCTEPISQSQKPVQDYMLKKLKPSTMYEFSLRCTDKENKLLKIYKPLYKKTKDNDQSTSQVAAEETDQCPREAETDQFSIASVTAGSVKVTLKATKKKENKYSLNTFQDGKCVVGDIDDSQEYTFIKLQPATLYEFNLRCFDAKSQNLIAVYKPLYQKTKADIPGFSVQNELNT